MHRACKGNHGTVVRAVCRRRGKHADFFGRMFRLAFGGWDLHRHVAESFTEFCGLHRTWFATTTVLNPVCDRAFFTFAFKHIDYCILKRLADVVACLLRNVIRPVFRALVLSRRQSKQWFSNLKNSSANRRNESSGAEKQTLRACPLLQDSDSFALPGYGKPSSFAVLSNASPAASSTLSPKSAVVAYASLTAIICVCPPETNSATKGKSGFSSANSGDSRCRF